ncbi:MAG: hypothetical protein ACLUNO_00615 [Oscillospiraceae bacterium]
MTGSLKSLPRGQRIEAAITKFCAERTVDEVEAIMNKAGIPNQKAFGPGGHRKERAVRRPQRHCHLDRQRLRRDEGHRHHEQVQEEPRPDRRLRADVRRAQPRGTGAFSATRKRRSTTCTPRA